jgi:hypothetical protein
MARFGRKVVFYWEFFLVLWGQALLSSVYKTRSFVIFCMGSIFMGFLNSFSTYFRFAAAEVSHRDFKSRAVSLVLASGVIAALVGPNLYKWGLSVFQELKFIGGFILIIPLVCGCIYNSIVSKYRKTSRNELED